MSSQQVQYSPDQMSCIYSSSAQHGEWSNQVHMEDVTNMLLPPGDRPRRQNRACDQCRGSKRRCLVSTTGDSRGEVKCTVCIRLDHECTFKLARSHSTKSKKQRNRHDTVQGPDVYEPIDSVSDDFGHFQEPFFDDHDTVNLSHNPWEMGVQFPGPWPDNSSPLFDALFHGLEPVLTPVLPENDILHVIPHDTSLYEREQSDPVPPALTSSQSVARRGIPNSSAVAWSRPLLLLNSSLTGKIIDEHLARIYNAIVMGNSSRWLQCELPPRSKGYQGVYQSNVVSLAFPINDEPRNNLLDRVLDPILLTAPLTSTQGLSDPIGEPSTNWSVPDMTLLGAVRFLDHFSGMYGNKLSPFAKRLSDTVLKDVLKVYAMQWLPAKGDSTNDHERSSPQISGMSTTSASFTSVLYHDTWSRAKTSVACARHVRSFRVFYATLLLDATAAPEQLQDWQDSNSSLLDDAFITLRELALLIRRHVKALASLSNYGMTLEKSLELIESFGCLRDTVSSLINDRRCKAPEDLVREISQMSLHHPGNSPAEDKIYQFNRRCLPKLLMTLRIMIACKNTFVEATLGDHETPGWHRNSLLSSAFEVIDEMEGLVRPILDASVEVFDGLEAECKLQLLTWCAIWSLGLLSFSEITKNLSRNDIDVDLATTLRKLHSCRWTAGLSLTQLMRRVSAQPSLEVFNQANGLDVELPMTGYHLTTELLVTSLRQAIEKVIDLRYSADFDLTCLEDFSLSVTVEKQWEESVDHLMKALLSLDITVGGAQAAGCASRDLIRAYGDILSDCWSADFET